MVKNLLMTMILLVLPLGLTSCGVNKVVIHPIEKQDIMVMPAGEAYTPDRDGYFFSKTYVKEVMDAKIR